MPNCLKFVLQFLVLSLAITVANAQKTYDNQLSVTLDNDRFAPRSTDKYYSNGLALNWHFAKTDSSFLFFKKIEKLIFRIGINHSLFTPSEITFVETWRLDRPYAATIALENEIQIILPNKSIVAAEVVIGSTGPIAKGKELQKWWHNKIKIFEPRGWENQIVNSPIIQLNLNYVKSLLDGSIIDFTSESNINFGTINSSIRQDLLVRIGKYASVNQTNFFKTAINANPKKTPFELFFFFDMGLEYVGYNGLIEGNWIGSESPHTEIAKRWVFHHQFGLQLSTGMLAASFGLNHLSAEVLEGTKHQYASIKMGIRF